MNELEMAADSERDAIHDEDWAREAGTLAFDSKRAYQKLVCGPYIDEDANKELWQAVLNDRENIEEALANLFLELRVDEHTGIAMAVNSPRKPDGVPHTIKKVALTMYETLFLCILRKKLIGSFEADRLLVDYDELCEEMRDYRLRCKKMDEVEWRRKLDNAWGRLVRKSFVLPTEQEGLFKMSPVIREVFTAEETANILRTYEEREADGNEGLPAEEQDPPEDDFRQEEREEGAEGWDDE